MKIEIQSNILRYLLRNVYFINGTAYAGKSTMVKLLAERHNGIECGENYHDALRPALTPELQPNLCYFDTMSGWQEFIGRTPEAYDAWYRGTALEATQLELAILLQLSVQKKPIFVDTNIPPAILKQIAPYERIAFMLSPREMSVARFFDRPDPDKQFLLQKIQEAEDPVAALTNFRDCIAEINSDAHYREFSESGCFTWLRRENSTIEEALEAIETHFHLI